MKCFEQYKNERSIKMSPHGLIIVITDQSKTIIILFDSFDGKSLYPYAHRDKYQSQNLVLGYFNGYTSFKSLHTGHCSGPIGDTRRAAPPPPPQTVPP